jgi:hypothetical protein
MCGKLIFNRGFEQAVVTMASESQRVSPLRDAVRELKLFSQALVHPAMTPRLDIAPCVAGKVST